MRSLRSYFVAQLKDERPGVQELKDKWAHVQAKITELDLAGPLARKYAAQAGWYWRVSRARVREAAPRVKANKRARREKARQQTLVQQALDEQHERAYDEFIYLASVLVPDWTCAQVKHLGIIRLCCFERATQREVEAAYPGVSRDTRYQWKRRGLKLLLQVGSEDLVAVIQRPVPHTHSA